MKNIWKWLFFILLILVVFAVAGGIFSFRSMLYGNWNPSNPMSYPFNNGNFDYHDRFDLRGGNYFSQPSMSMPYMFMPFMFFGAASRLLPLVLIGLAAWGIYRLGFSKGQSHVVPPTSPKQPDATTAAPSSESEVEIK